MKSRLWPTVWCTAAVPGDCIAVVSKTVGCTAIIAVLLIPISVLCFSCRMSTSSATRRLSSTWVASTTMQRKWRDDHPSSSFRVHRRTNEWSEGGRPGLKNSVDFWISFSLFYCFAGVRLKGEFYSNKDKRQQRKQQHEKSVSNSERTHRRVPRVPWSQWVCWLSMCNPYTYLSVPVWRTYNNMSVVVS